MVDFETYLSASELLDFNSEVIQNIVHPIAERTKHPKARAVAVYYAVRDGWRYDPYSIYLHPKQYKASVIAQRKGGHCIDKAILTVAMCRALDVPARMRLAKVANHIAVERLTEKFGTNELTPHGMADIWIEDKWLKVSPAFNKELCKMVQVAPLDFDGENDAVLQEYNAAGHQFMEYIEDYGSFDDVPIAFIIQNFIAHYPKVIEALDENVMVKL